ncbi:MAG: SIMPL domain-containing protein [Fibrobacter sp.]|nr:SIMPL domain-containing protein [Fibrobacter sp.]
MKKLAYLLPLSAALTLAGCNCCENTNNSNGANVSKVELTASKSQKFAANEYITEFSLELADPDKEDLYKQLSERRAKIFEIAQGLDITEADIQQNSVSLQKDWAYNDGKRSLRGYKATQQFMVKVDSRKTAAMLTMLLSKESDIEIYPAKPSLKSKDSLQGVIIEAAVKNGMEKAKHYATGAGKQLGNVVYISGEGDGIATLGAAPRFRKFVMNSMDVVESSGAGLDESSIADSVEISSNVRLIVELK